ncbi:hypothetical protein GWK47_016659 [Chionoecetes opilio]|uniref:Secreted protein n=1 Tax=Chionoecetes opilio TaxID=41210 RepID=A0A8J4XRS7_CHIOP|nr:hypothetical protein GWK47_016659 [Chionoecetes opilio]
MLGKVCSMSTIIVLCSSALTCSGSNVSCHLAATTLPRPSMNKMWASSSSNIGMSVSDVMRGNMSHQPQPGMSSGMSMPMMSNNDSLGLLLGGLRLRNDPEWLKMVVWTRVCQSCETIPDAPRS